MEQGIAVLQHCRLYVIIGGGPLIDVLVGYSQHEEEAPDQIAIHYFGTVFGYIIHHPSVKLDINMIMSSRPIFHGASFVVFLLWRSK